MVQLQHLNYRELPLVEKIIRDETWLEGERRGHPVGPDDPVVRAKVCEIVLRVAHEWREKVVAELDARPGPRRIEVSPPEQDKAA